MLIWNVLKRAALDFWDEMFYLILLNVVWFIGSLFIIPLPFFTFSLWYTAHDVSQGKGIGFKTFFIHLRQTWKHALIWGGINLGLALIVILNINFYANIGTQWASAGQVLIIATALFWSIIQLVALSLYPRLEDPGFRLATRNAAVLVAKHPLPVFTLVAIVVLIGFVSSIFPILFLLGTVSFIAMLTNRLVKAIVYQEMGWTDER